MENKIDKKSDLVAFFDSLFLDKIKLDKDIEKFLVIFDKAVPDMAYIEDFAATSACNRCMSFGKGIKLNFGGK